MALSAALATPAHADRIEDLIGQLSKSSSYKVRLSAVLTLTKLGDRRAIPALLGALTDSEKTVRGVAAAGLAELVDASTPKRTRDRVVAALLRASKRDKNNAVRRQARKAYAKLEALDRAPAGGSIFVDVGRMGDKTGSSGLVGLMRKTVEKTFRAKAAQMTIGMPGGAAPSRTQMKRMKAFHVDGTLTALDVTAKGRSSEVACKVSMLMATFPKKSMFGFLSGGARVQTGSSARDIAFGKEDCVAAVVEDLIARKVIPTLRSRGN